MRTSWNCLAKVMNVLNPYELDVSTQSPKQEERGIDKWANVSVKGIKHNVLAIQRCMNMVDSHGSFDAVYRLRFEKRHNYDTPSMFSDVVRHNFIRSQTNPCFIQDAKSSFIPIDTVWNIDNTFWGPQYTMSSLMKAWVRHVVDDTAQARHKSQRHPENAMCIAAASNNITMQISCHEGPAVANLIC